MMMFRKLISYILCWRWCIALAAQTSGIDSLELLLSSVGNNNMERSKLLIELSNEYLSVDTVKCKNYALEALRLAQNSRSEYDEGVAYNTLGNSYRVASQPYLAHVNYKKAEKLFLKLQDREGLYKIYQNLMLLFLDLEDVENVVYYAGKVQEMAEERNDLTNEINAQFILGWARFGDNEEDALDYYLNMYRKAIPLNSTITYFIAVHCGQIFILRNQPREALKYLHPACEHFEEDGIMQMPEIYGYLAEAYAMINQVDSSEYYMKKAQDSPVVSDDTRLILYRSRSSLHLIRGDYKSALTEFKLYHHLSDSIAKAGRTTEMARIKVWHEFDQKELEKTLLQQEYQKQRNLTIVLAVTLVMALVLLGLVVFFYRKITEKNRVITGQNHEMAELHTVKDKLFSVVAHDLRGPIATLMAVLKLTRMKELDTETQVQLTIDASKRVDDVHGLLDNLLRWAKNQMQGIKPTQVYFNIQEESLVVTDTLLDNATAKGVILRNRIKKQEVFADRDMYAVALRNLTTNAIKYSSAGDEVIIDSDLSDNMLVISVKDTGTGMSQEVQNKLFKLSETKSQRGTDNENGTGLGLVLCADFVKASGGRIWFTSEQGKGSTFFFSIPVKG